MLPILKAILPNWLAECHQSRHRKAFMQVLIPGGGPLGGSISPVKRNRLAFCFTYGSFVSLVRISQPCHWQEINSFVYKAEDWIQSCQDCPKVSCCEAPCDGRSASPCSQDKVPGLQNPGPMLNDGQSSPLGPWLPSGS